MDLDCAGQFESFKKITDCFISNHWNLGMIAVYNKSGKAEVEKGIEFTAASPLLSRIKYNSKDWWKRWTSRGRTKNICVTSKVSLLTLCWCFSIGIVHGLSSNPSRFLYERLRLELVSLIYVLNAVVLCFYPLAGYLADNIIGRYKIIKRSLLILIIAPIVAVLPFITFLVSYSSGYGALASMVGIIIVSVLFYVAINVSFVTFDANIIQFGIEQLYDSPADHQSLYIYWYVWIFYFVQILIVQPWSFIFRDFIAGMFLFSILGCGSYIIIAVSLCLTYYIKRWFLINPARINPYKLVYKITHFARQHKVPIRRSAFTYCEDEIPSGLDLAKTKYGGPFTTEEVEDVKALYGILTILLSLGPVFFFNYASDPAFFWYTRNGLKFERNDSNNYFYNHIFDKNVTSEQFAYQYFMDSDVLSSLAVIVLIPLYIFTIKPFQCCHPLNMLQRMGLGILFQIMTLASIVALICSINPGQHSCMFQRSHQNNNYSMEVELHGIRSYLPILSRILYGISNALQYTALYEFICAQSPPSMKGLLIGLSFAIKGVFYAMGAVFVIPFSFIPKESPSCGVWYYGINVLLAIVAFILFISVARKYEYRQRDEISKVYRYAEEYYSKRPIKF